MERLTEEFIKLGYAVDAAAGRQHGVVIIRNFLVQVGRHAGKVLDVGIPGNDFPFTPPAGVHFRPELAPNGANNINKSPLGTGWQYWSRRLTDWQIDRSARHIISYVNKVLLDA